MEKKNIFDLVKRIWNENREPPNHSRAIIAVHEAPPKQLELYQIYIFFNITYLKQICIYKSLFSS